jgi:hypothetical protein
MRKITANAVQSFYKGKKFTRDNTQINIVNVVDADSYKLSEYYLYDNLIATYNHNNDRLKITTSGWNTVTTRERLNGLKNVSLRNSKGILYLNDKAWDGNWIEVL